jgi:E3 ubiquitin-protein ligase ATL6/9/15/31/42/55
MASKNYSSLTHPQQPPLSDKYTYAYNPSNSKFNPTMGIIIVALGSALIFVAFFTVYVRRCAIANAEQDLSSAAAGNPTSSTSRQPKGLDKSVVESLPVVHFKDLNFQHVADEKVDGGHGKNEKDDVHRECAVCLSEFETEDSLRLLPKCNHVFHLECIDVWFRSHSTCPLCRASLVPTTDVQQVPDAGARLDQAESVVIEPEQEREGDGGQGVLQVPFEVVVVTIDGGDVGESAREQEQEAAQLAVPVAAPTRSGVAREGKIRNQWRGGISEIFSSLRSLSLARSLLKHVICAGEAVLRHNELLDDSLV